MPTAPAARLLLRSLGLSAVPAVLWIVAAACFGSDPTATPDGPSTSDSAFPVLRLSADSGRASTTEVGAAGGLVNARAADGTRLTLAIPEGAVDADIAITITPLSGVDDLPVSGRLLAGVDIKPDGLLLNTPAALTLSLPSGSDAASLIGFGYRGDGRAFRPLPVTVIAGQATITVGHFSGFGVLEGGFRHVDSFEELAARCIGGRERSRVTQFEYYEDRFHRQFIASGVEDGVEYSTVYRVENYTDPGGGEMTVWTFVDGDGTESERIRLTKPDGSVAESNTVNGEDVPASELDALFSRDPRELAEAQVAREGQRDVGRELRELCGTVEVTPPAAEIDIGEAVQLLAIILDAGGAIVPGAVFTWSSADTGVATVSDTGLVTGVVPGVVQIAAHAGRPPISPDYVGHATITVGEAPTPIPLPTETPTPEPTPDEPGDGCRVTRHTPQGNTIQTLPDGSTADATLEITTHSPAGDIVQRWESTAIFVWLPEGGAHWEHRQIYSETRPPALGQSFSSESQEIINNLYVRQAYRAYTAARTLPDGTEWVPDGSELYYQVHGADGGVTQTVRATYSGCLN